MKLPCTNKYLSLNTLNYFMFFANIGFIIYIYFSDKEEPIIPYELVFLSFNYYRFIIPICFILILVHIFQERGLKLSNSKMQKVITNINYSFLILILLSFVLCIAFVAIIAHGLDM